MYLHRELTDCNGKTFEMVGVIPETCQYMGKLVRFGYIEIEETVPEFLPEQEKIRGHEFHYFDSTDNGSAFTAVKPSGRASWPCMRVFRQVLAGYPHLYYASNPAFAAHFVAACRRRKESRTEVIH